MSRIGDVFGTTVTIYSVPGCGTLPPGLQRSGILRPHPLNSLAQRKGGF